MKSIEYRFLQIILSHVAGDRITLALLHWDGERLRVGSQLASPVLRDLPHREIVERTVTVKLARAARQAEQAAAGLSLSEVVPVREGLGAALYWSPLRTSTTSDAEAHFRELCAGLRLEVAGSDVRSDVGKWAEAQAAREQEEPQAPRPGAPAAATRFRRVTSAARSGRAEARGLGELCPVD
jgi:hypothetical protein